MKHNKLYLPVYGHLQPTKNPPTALYSPTNKEKEVYQERFHLSLQGTLPLEVSHPVYNLWNLEPLTLLTEPSLEIRRIPYSSFGHHNQFLNLPSPDHLQTAGSITKVYFGPHYNPEPLTLTHPIEHLLDRCVKWQIPLHSALRFLAWEMRRGGRIPYTFSELQRLDELIEVQPHIERLMESEEIAFSTGAHLKKNWTHIHTRKIKTVSNNPYRTAL